MTCQTSFDSRDNLFGPLPVVNPQHYTAHECDAARVAALLAAGANPCSPEARGVDGPPRGACRWRLRRRPARRPRAQRQVHLVVRAQGPSRRHWGEADVRLWRTRLVEAHLLKPLVWWFLPSDAIKITKRGNALPVDTNHVWMNTIQPVYLRATVLFLGTKSLVSNTDTQTAGRHTSSTTTRRQSSGSARRSGSTSTRSCSRTSTRRMSCRGASRSSRPARSASCSASRATSTTSRTCCLL